MILLISLLWFTVVISILGSVGAVLLVGKPRKPLSETTVLITLILNGLVIWGASWAAVALV